jgi:hypothetical protein
VTAFSVDPADEGDTVYVGGEFSDPNLEDTHTATWDWGDGSPLEQGMVVEVPDSAHGTVLGNHEYGDNGEYTITLTVTDDHGAESFDTTTVTITNVAPSASIASDVEIYSGELAYLTGAFSDSGWLDTHTSTWNWDDGTIIQGLLVEENDKPDSSGTVTGSHQYYLSGEYNVALSVTDDDGGSDVEYALVTVKRIPVPIDINPGGYPNAINIRNKGLIPVAILNDPTWTPYYIDPSMVNPVTVKFMDADPVRWVLEDVDYDGDSDLLLHYETRETSIVIGDTEAWIFGDLFDQRQIEGVDDIKTLKK